MPKKGITNNPAGRPKGSQNKRLIPIREKLHQLSDGYNVEEMARDLRKLEPGKRLRIFIGLAEYCLPKLARTKSCTSQPPLVQTIIVQREDTRS